MRFTSKQYTFLELLPANPKRGAVAVLSGGGETQRKDAFCWRLCFTLLPDTAYQLFLEDCAPGFSYLCKGEEICEEGIQILTPDTADTPYRETAHFTPPCGWLNDPNGLCFHGGWYHLYYQFYPHAQSWGNMHWGHAISRDLVDWKHQRVFLTPQQELLEEDALAGGAFSGSAVPWGDIIRFYFTRHIASKQNESTMRETQVVVESENGISCGPETLVVENDRPEFSYHFRDPKVFFQNGIWGMVLGSCVGQTPAVLLYLSRDGLSWEYTGPVLSIDAPGCESVECPDLFCLADQFVLIAAQMSRVEECGRKNPLWYYAGSLTDGRLAVWRAGLFDFGGNLYALQTFERAGRRIAIGWIADFYQEHREHPGGVCGSMSLPRELSWRDGRLQICPAKEVYTMLGGQLWYGERQNAHLQGIAGNAYYAKICFDSPVPFTAVLASDAADELRLEYDGGQIRLISTRLPEVCFCTSCGEVTAAEIFFDRRVAEIFINEGETAGVKTFYTEQETGAFLLASPKPDKIASIQVRRFCGQHT